MIEPICHKATLMIWRALAHGKSTS